MALRIRQGNFCAVRSPFDKHTKEDAEACRKLGIMSVCNLPNFLRPLSTHSHMFNSATLNHYLGNYTTIQEEFFFDYFSLFNKVYSKKSASHTSTHNEHPLTGKPNLIYCYAMRDLYNFVVIPN